MREKQIDVLKAFGIILVIVGHTQSPFNGWIYTFHMPLFFFVSGFLRCTGQAKPWGKFLAGKVRSSLLPYVVFWGISVILCKNLYPFLMSPEAALLSWNEIKGLLLGGHWLADNSNNFPLWYLQHYFIASIVFEVIVRYFHPALKTVVCIALLLVTVPIQAALPVRPVFHINILPAALVFMLAGYALRWLLTRSQTAAKLCAALPIGGALLVLGWRISAIHGGNIATIKSYLYFAGAVCTIVGLYIIANRLRECRVLQYVGTKTLYIMGLHVLTLGLTGWLAAEVMGNIGLSNEFVQNVLQVFLSLVLCCAAAEVFQIGKDFVASRFRRKA